MKLKFLLLVVACGAIMLSGCSWRMWDAPTFAQHDADKISPQIAGTFMAPDETCTKLI